MSLPEGRLGTGVDEQNSPLKECDLAASGYTKKQSILVRVTQINQGRREVLHERHVRGRPEKGPEAVEVYRRLFPNGHKADGLINATAAAKVSEVMGTSVSWKTIKNHF